MSLPLSAAADPGELTAVEIDTRGNNYGYWEYLPTTHNDEEEWPVLIFLSGIGEIGNGLDDGPCSWPPGPPDFDGGEGQCNNLRHGPQTLIFRALTQGTPWLWDEDSHPFILVAPQNPIVGDAYDTDELGEFFDYLLGEYSINERRQYLTGMSQGGRSTLLYTNLDPDRFAAVSVMPGIAGAEVVANACAHGQQGFWGFHGENDGGAFVPQTMINFVNAYNACPEPHPTARLTMYLNAGHNVWSRTIQPDLGMDDAVDDAWDPYDVALYDWLLSYDKPLVYGGPDLLISEDDGEFDLFASVEDDDVSFTWTWTQTSGTPMTLGGDDTATLTVSDLAVGMHTFEVHVLDADDQFDVDIVQVEVVAGGGGEESTSTGFATLGSTSELPTGTSTTEAGASSSSDGGDTSSGTASVGTGSESSGTSTGSLSTTGATETSSSSGGAATGGSTGTTGGDTSGGTDPGSTGVPLPVSASATAGDSTPTAGGTSNDDPQDTDADSDSGSGSSDDTGCACSASPGAPHGWALLLFSAGLMLRRRRR